VQNGKFCRWVQILLVILVRVQPPREVQPNKMEIEMVALGVAHVRRRAILLVRATLLEIGIHILDPNIFMWI